METTLETVLGVVIAGLVASGMTWLELDKTFYVPKNVVERWKLRLWWWGFVVLNGIVAGVLYAVADEIVSFKQQINPWPLRALLMGASYLALIRLKFGTVQTDKGEVSVGLEAFYEGLKEAFLFCLRRNRNLPPRELAAILSRWNTHDPRTSSLYG
jgi:hypothetical protein